MDQDIIGTVFVVAPYGLAVIFAVLLLVVLYAMYRGPVVAAIVVLGVTLWEACVQQMPVIRLGAWLSPLDFVFASIGLVAILRLLFIPRTVSGLPWPVIILLAGLAFSFFLGLSNFGVRAGVEFRGDYYFWAVCVYILTFPPEPKWIGRLLDVWLVGALLLCLVVWYRWMAQAFGFDWFDPFWRYLDTSVSGFARVAPSSVALIVGLATLVLVSAIVIGKATPLHFLLLPALLLTIVFLQHRSVWVATLLPLLTLVLLRGQRKRGSRGALLAAFASIAIVGVVLTSGVLGGAAESVTQQAVRATSTTEGTFVARVDGWQELVRRWAGLGPVGLVLGEPYGSGYERHIGGTWGGTVVAFAPHNYFVVLLLRAGLLGLVTFVWLLWQLMVTGFSGKSIGIERFDSPMVLAVGMCIVLYCIPYSPTPASGLLFGIALCVSHWTRNYRISDESLRSESENFRSPRQAGHAPREHGLVSVEREFTR